MRITQIHDQLAVIGEDVLDIELVNVALNGFTKAQESFIMCICTQKYLPKWERLWDDYIQEDTCKEYRNKKRRGATNENLFLASEMKKTKGKIFIKKGDNC